MHRKYARRHTHTRTLALVLKPWHEARSTATSTTSHLRACGCTCAAYVCVLGNFLLHSRLPISMSTANNDHKQMANIGGTAWWEKRSSFINAFSLIFFCCCCCFFSFSLYLYIHSAIDCLCIYFTSLAASGKIKKVGKNYDEEKLVKWNREKSANINIK